MFEKRLTLLIIPEEGEKTHERFKVPRAVLWAVGLCLLCGTGLIAVGMRFAQSATWKSLSCSCSSCCSKRKWNRLISLNRCCCARSSNEQLRAILENWDEGDAQGNATGSDGPFISAQRRLNWGYVESVPTAWAAAPVRCCARLARRFQWLLPQSKAVRSVPVRVGPWSPAADTVLGQLIIIDHGNGIETHYGYNSALFVSEESIS